MNGTHACIDCIAEVRDDARLHSRKPRKIANPGDGPARCTTHLRRFKTRQKQLARGSHVERTYEISAKDAGELLAYQGGRCWICQKATGASKLLAIEHDHADDWVRGRLCSTCNQFVTRQMGDDPAAAQRMFEYLSGDTPYRRMLAERMILRYAPQAKIKDVKVTTTGEVLTVWFLAEGAPFWEHLNTTLETLQTFATPKGTR